MEAAEGRGSTRRQHQFRVEGTWKESVQLGFSTWREWHSCLSTFASAHRRGPTTPVSDVRVGCSVRYVLAPYCISTGSLTPHGCQVLLEISMNGSLGAHTHSFWGRRRDSRVSHILSERLFLCFLRCHQCIQF